MDTANLPQAPNGTTLRDNLCNDAFDAVVMLTWSDWAREPRSNRYHYATRFARRWPVYFVQADGADDDVTFAPVDGHNIQIVRTRTTANGGNPKSLAQALQARGVRRPLVWVYNLDMADAIARLHPALTVYHATEDYIAPPDSVQITPSSFADAARKMVARADLVVAVSAGVAASHRPHVAPGKRLIVLENGCDFAFWQATRAAAYQPPADGAKVALFQGGINARLDYPLLEEVAAQLADWQLWFCGPAQDGGAAWQALKRRANVHDFGMQTSDGIAALARQALVGLIPFKDSGLMRRSLPLKAYEYLACGLPVVSTPIDALVRDSDHFSFAHTAPAFAAAIAAAAPRRTEPNSLAARQAAAARMSYDARFDELMQALDEEIGKIRARPQPLNVVVLYDDASTHVGAIAEHVQAFADYSRHNIFLMPCTGDIAGPIGAPAQVDFSAFDVVVIHFSVRVSVVRHLNAAVAAAVSAFTGPKMLFVQDEYDRVETTRAAILDLGISTVFTTVPLDQVDKVYPRDRFGHVQFVATLTGYVTDNGGDDLHLAAPADRHVRIGYRGRTLPHHYGALGREKYDIGVKMRAFAQARGVAVDIEVDDGRRIYGGDWLRFLSSARATLGTESGANVFDEDGSLADLAERHRDMPFEEFAARFLRDHEGRVRMNQISPKIFEAIRLRTALILFEGAYSGVVKPDLHYIPLAKDYSNVDAVFAKLEDAAFLEELTARAYRDIIASGAYSYRQFVADWDAVVTRSAGPRARTRIVSAPVLAFYDPADGVNIASSGGGLLSNVVLGGSLSRAALRRFAAPPPTPAATPSVITVSATNWRLGRAAWRRLPVGLRAKMLALAREAASGARPRPTPASHFARLIWRLLPGALQTRIANRLG